MEASILLGILGAGYLWNKNKDNNDDDNNNNNINQDLPKQEDAYTTDYFHDDNKSIDHSTNLYDNYKTIQIPGVKNINYQNIGEYLNLEENDTSNTEGKEYIHSSIAGSKISKDDFLENDQGIKIEPFFTKAPPNINLTENHHLARHQGHSGHRIKKKETTPFFENYKSENVFGQIPHSDEIRSKIYVSSSMKNVLPFEQTQVGHIDVKNMVNVDIAKQYYENNSIDNIRTLNNQQVSYEGRILPGKGEEKLGKIGQVFKHTPENDYFNSPDKWLTTTGAYTADTQRPEQIVPNTNRQFFNKQELGIAGSTSHDAQTYRSKYAVSGRQNFAADSVRNAAITNDQMNNDTIQNSYQMYPNERDITTLRTYDSNISTEVKDQTLGLMDDIKGTIKQTTLIPANNGFINGADLPTERLYDEIKKTKKQTTINSKHNGNIKGPDQPTSAVEAPEGTIKDSTLFDYTGNAMSSAILQMNETQYKNAETNATKEIIAQGRYPTPQGDKYYNSKETYNIEVKKNEGDYFTHRQSHYDRMNPEYLPKNTCNFTQMKNKLNDSSLADRVNNDILTPFKNNPYTQSLESFAY